MPKKHIQLRGMIGFDDNATPEFLEKELASANGSDIVLEINSPGGFVMDGLEMSNMVRNYSGHVTAQVVGLAASMASYIPMMADSIEVEDNTVFMIHNPYGFGFGDYRDMEKAGALFKSLAQLLGKAYVAQTGKTTDEIAALMGEDTFLFGEEIVSEGFADVVAGESEGESDKASAVLKAQGEILACKELVDEALKSNPVNTDKIAALLNRVEPKPKPTQEKKTMTLKEFLEKNPEAKAEYDADVKAATDDGRKSGQDALKMAIPILSSDQYPDKVKEKIGEMALKGDSEGIKTQTGILEMMAETTKSEAAEEEGAGETPADMPENGGDTETNFQATKARLQSNYGV